MSTPPPPGPIPGGEFNLIRWIRENSRPNPDSTILGIGDDCAILRLSPGSDLVTTTDMLMDGRHFHLEQAGARAVGFKAMAVNISDIAAMAARPVAALVAVALPRKSATAVAQGLHAGMAEVAAAYGVSLIGGDTNAWDGPLVICVTLLGESTGRGPVRRAGARPGDLIYVTGPLGGSILGRHLRPAPLIAEALALNDAYPVHAMIDISDGLTSDLGHILDESGGVGALLDEESIPIHPEAVEMSRLDGRPALEHALNDGEDFELCVVLSPEDALDLEQRPISPARLIRVGRIVSKPGVWMVDGSGQSRRLESAGFDHLR